MKMPEKFTAATVVTALGLALTSLSACTEGHGYTASSPRPSRQAAEYLKQHDSTASNNLPEYKLAIKDHQFSQPEVKIPANQKVKLLITNNDAKAEEFYCFKLNREVVISAGKERPVYIGPVEAGQYECTGHYHPKTAHMVIIAE